MTGAKRRVRLSSSSPYGGRRETVTVNPKQQNQTAKASKLKRFPFHMWALLISLYCCIVCLHRSFLRIATRVPATSQEAVLMQNNKSSSTPTALDVRQGRIVHVIQTRFMQHQPNLIELGFARLALFETFCLPSILGQTGQNFVWIIRVDPNLNEEILKRIRHRISHRENIILIGSNHNPEGMGRDNSDFDHFLGAGRNENESTGKVLGGNATYMKEVFESSAERSTTVLLETRLDADDALHKMYVEFVQNQAQQYLMRNSVWRVWCAHSTAEWHPLNPFPVSSNNGVYYDEKVREEGYLLMYSDKGICATPGLTFGYGFNTNRANVLQGRRLRHSDIVTTIPHCDNSVVLECVSRLTALSPGALRARTATSAGMVNIITGNDGLDQRNNGLKQQNANEQLLQQSSKQDLLWKGVGRLFSVTKSSVRDIRTLIVSRMKYIAIENLKGLCTPGHSCKENGKFLLSAISSAEAKGR